MKITDLFLFLFFLVFTTEYGKTEEDVSATFSCNDLESHSVALRLKNYLFCEYDQSVRPVESDGKATIVHFALTPKSIDFDESTNIIDIDTWTSLVWKDAHLTWKPSDYDDTKSLKVMSYEIWLPDLATHSVGYDTGNVITPETHCMVYHTGHVYCVMMTVYNSHCTTDYTWWPYDAMNCTIQFASWSHSNDEIDFRFLPGGLFMENFTQNHEWDVVRSYMSERIQHFKFDDDYNSKILSLNMILKRHASMYSSIYLSLIMVLVVMTLVTLWLDSKTIERMIIANMNFILHLFFIMDIHWHIPHNGKNTPKLVYLYEASFILTSLSLILTSILRQLQEMRVEPPLWISSSTTSIIRSKVGRILLMSILDPKVSAKIEIDAEDNAELVNANKKGSGWKYVAILIGWVAFLIVLIVYVILFSMYIPTSSSGEPYILNT